MIRINGFPLGILPRAFRGMDPRSTQVLHHIQVLQPVLRSQLQVNDGSFPSCLSTMGASLLKLEREFEYIERFNVGPRLRVQGGYACCLSPRARRLSARAAAAALNMPTAALARTILRKTNSYIDGVLQDPLAAQRHFQSSDIYFAILRSIRSLPEDRPADVKFEIHYRLRNLDANRWICPVYIDIAHDIIEQVYADCFLAEDGDEESRTRWYFQQLSQSKNRKLVLFADSTEAALNLYDKVFDTKDTRAQVSIAAYRDLSTHPNILLSRRYEFAKGFRMLTFDPSVA